MLTLQNSSNYTQETEAPTGSFLCNSLCPVRSVQPHTESWGHGQTRQCLPTRERWEELKDILELYYVQHGVKLKDIVKVMATKHDLRATEAMFKKRFSRWGFEKYVKRNKRQAQEMESAEVHDFCEGCPSQQPKTFESYNRSPLRAVRRPSTHGRHRKSEGNIQLGNDAGHNLDFASTSLTFASETHRNAEHVFTSIRSWFVSMSDAETDALSYFTTDRKAGQFFALLQDGVCFLDTNPTIGWSSLEEACDMAISLLRCTHTSSLLPKLLRLVSRDYMWKRHVKPKRNLLCFFRSALEQFTGPEYPLLVILKLFEDHLLMQTALESLPRICDDAVRRKSDVAYNGWNSLELEIAWTLMYEGRLFEAPTFSHKGVKTLAAVNGLWENASALKDLSLSYRGRGGVSCTQVDFEMSIKYFYSALHACWQCGGSHAKHLESRVWPGLAWSYRSYAMFLQSRPSLDQDGPYNEELQHGEETCRWKHLDIELELDSIGLQVVAVFDLAECLWHHSNYNRLDLLKERVRVHRIVSKFPKVVKEVAVDQDSSVLEKWWMI